MYLHLVGDENQNSYYNMIDQITLVINFHYFYRLWLVQYLKLLVRNLDFKNFTIFRGNRQFLVHIKPLTEQLHTRDK